MTRFRKEIGEQPSVAARLLKRSRDAVTQAAEAITAARPAALLIAARGSSDHAAIYGKYLFETRNRLSVALAAPSVFTMYRRPPNLKSFCVLAISQSGTSPDVVAVVAEARRQGAPTIAITNSEDSPLARLADHIIPLEAGAERSVPATKTYTASLLVLALLSQALTPDQDFKSALDRTPDALRATLSLEDEIGEAARLFLNASRMVVLGRGYHLATAHEIGLKVMEASYLICEARSIADFMHGPVAIIEPGFAVLLLDAKGPLSKGARGLSKLLTERGARVAAFTDRSSRPPGCELWVRIETGLPESLTPMPYGVAGQLLTNYLAAARGLDPDRPRGLEKVTRTT